MMCKICRQIPCDFRCPNAPDPVAVKICSRCADGIMEGDEYLESDEGPICGECLSDMTVREYLDFVGDKLITA